ncbi:MAG: helix-turn-helix transcriptional regulator [Nitrospira sp.]
MNEFLNSYLAMQIKFLRESRSWTQEELGAAADMAQERIAVLENVNHSAWKISTLQKIAKAFDLTLSVSFENFSAQIRKLDNFTAESMGSLARTPRVQDLSVYLHRTPIKEATAVGIPGVEAIGTAEQTNPLARTTTTGRRIRRGTTQRTYRRPSRTSAISDAYTGEYIHA